MKCVILAGGRGSRISEETFDKPKPLIKICGKPILVHIMEIYEKFNYTEFIICLGYKGEVIKEYFQNYEFIENDFKIDFKSNKLTKLTKKKIKYLITFVDTGINSNTGERLKRIKKYIGKDENFFFTYGDGVGNININEILKFHYKNKKTVTMTVSNPPGRFGVVKFKKNSTLITKFKEKVSDNSWVNSGFFVMNKKIFNLLEKYDNPILENEPLEELASTSNLIGYKNKNFWQPVDALRDKEFLEKMLNKFGSWFNVK